MRKPKTKDIKTVLANNIILHGKIKTTKGKAKLVRPFLERLITKSKDKTLANYRYLLKFLPKKSADKLFYEISPRYKERNGGYLRITAFSKRRTKDGAEMAIIEFV